METVIGVVLCAALFVIFTVLSPKHECSGHCGACTGACERAGRSD